LESLGWWLVRQKNNFIRAFELPAEDFALSDKALQVRSQQVNNKHARPGRQKTRVGAPAGAGTLASRVSTSPHHGAPMQCFVYASLAKADTYLWLAGRDAFEILPEPLTLMLGELRFVMEVQLTLERKLPVEDTRQVLGHLRTQGWYLQLPPQETLAAANHLAYTHSPRDDRDE
jgi:uncharacterized protein YcgL (UPF0745 family)